MLHSALALAIVLLPTFAVAVDTAGNISHASDGSSSGTSSGSSSGSCANDDTCDRYAAALQPDAHHDGHHHNDQLPLFGLSLVLVGGGAIQHFGSGIPLPYTVLLLLFGTAIGFWILFDSAFTLQPGMKAGEHMWSGATLQCNVTNFVPNDLNYNGWHFGNSVRMLAGMDPHLFLHVLLPPLLFESAFAIDWHIFSKVKLYALFLALPGLVVCTSLTGLTYMAFYGWSWEAAMLLGGILSATDPVAVVALLREMGVKKSLATLIEAESLLNDGTAVVVYSILLKAVQAKGLEPWLDESSDFGGWYILWFFFRMSVIGPLLGIGLGVISVRWLEANAGADRDANVEVICTLAMPFLVFYLAETAFGEAMQMSGVLAVVCYGLVFASPYGKVRIDPGVEHFLHEFWGMVGHLTNTIIFVLSGVIIVISIDVRRASFATDVGFGLAAYACMTIYRGIVMFGVIPLFSKSQYGYTWKDALVITWGGLRGAVGLALAVAVYGDGQVTVASGMFGDVEDGCEPGRRFQQVVLLHVSMTVVMTLVVNAPTSGPILRAIGMTRLSDERVTQLQMATDLLAKRTVASLRLMASHSIHSDVNWVGVQRLADFEQMKAAILGNSKYAFDEAKAWTPDEHSRFTYDSAHGGEHGGAHGGEQGGEGACTPKSRHERNSHSHEEIEAIGLRRRRRATRDATSPQGQKPGTPAASPDEKRVRVHAAHLKWRGLQTKMLAYDAFSEDFINDFKKRLHTKRMREAKSRMLETLKANVWGMFERGGMLSTTASRLDELILEAMDDVEASRKLEDHNPLPFAPLAREVEFKPAVLKLAHLFESCAHKSIFLRPFEHVANNLMFGDFARGFDITVAYLLGLEEVLVAHDHGHYKFSLDATIDLEFKRIVKKNIADATKALATLRLQWPKLCTALNTFKAARQVLNSGKALIDHLKHFGGLHENETERLYDLIAQAAVNLKAMSPVEALPLAERDHFVPEHFATLSMEDLGAEVKRIGGTVRPGTPPAKGEQVILEAPPKGRGFSWFKTAAAQEPKPPGLFKVVEVPETVSVIETHDPSRSYVKEAI